MENEKRLVNAEAIARKLKNAHCAECNVVRQIQCSACWVNDVLELLDGDSVDAVEVVHGRWVAYESDETYGPYDSKEWYKCSECGKDAYGRCYDDEWYSSPILSDYCPNCGADMRGTTDGKE